MIGTKLGSYTIERELGRGGMGAVYVATHALLGRKAAIKVLLPAMSRDEVVQRFFNEARAATAIKHPGIIEVFDYGTAHDGSAFIVMELLDGESLASRLKRVGPVSSEFAIAITRQVASALAAAHRAGIVHRDLKPDNVFLVADPDVQMGERIKLLDFGIAKLVSPDGKLDMALTHTGALMGTPYYMSPEQCRGAALVDARSDLYSLGCMLFEMVTGRVPFLGEGLGDIIGAHIHVRPVSPRSLVPGVTPELDELIVRLLAKAPSDRPASADALADELAALAQGRRLPPRVSEPPAFSALEAPRVAVSSPTNLTASARSAAAVPKRKGRLLFAASAAVMLAAVATVVWSRRNTPATIVASASTDAALVATPDDVAIEHASDPDAAPPVDATAGMDAAIAQRPVVPERTHAGAAHVVNGETMEEEGRVKDLVRAHRCDDARAAARATKAPNRNELIALAGSCIEKKGPADSATSTTAGPTWPTAPPPKWIATLSFGPVTVSDRSEYEHLAQDFDQRKSSLRDCFADNVPHAHQRISSAKVSVTITVPVDRDYAKVSVSGGDPISARCVYVVLHSLTWSPIHASAPVTMKTSFTVTIK